MSGRSQRNGRRNMSPREMRRAGVSELEPARKSSGLGDDFEPVEIDATGPAITADQVPFFSIITGYEDGSPIKETFTIPKMIPPNIVIRYMQNLREVGSDVAQADLIADVLGEDAMRALADCEHVTEENMKHLMAILEDKTLSAFEKYQGNS